MHSSKRALFSLRRTAFLGMVLLILAIFFTQFAVAAEKNVSISGIKFLDANSNGKYDSSEQPLQGYTIYVDENRDSQWDQNKEKIFNKTDKDGRYEFNKIPASGILREHVSSGDQLQLSSPVNGYDLANVENGTQDLNFGNSIPKAADSAPNKSLLYLIGGLAALIILGGGILLIIGLLRLNSLTNEDIREDRRTIIQMVSGFILLLLGLYLLISIAQMSSNMMTIGMSGSLALVSPVVLALLVFGAVLLMLYIHLKIKENEPGVMRKTIAGILVLGLIAVVLFSLTGTIQNENQNIITQYIQLVAIVIAFYFGSKATEDAYKGVSKGDEGKANEDLDITSATYNTNTRTIQIKISNNKKRNFDLNEVLIKEGDKTLLNESPQRRASEALTEFNVDLVLSQEKMNDLAKILKDDKTYEITIKTSIGDKITTCNIVKDASCIGPNPP
jgi:hypothetical protein